MNDLLENIKTKNPEYVRYLSENNDSIREFVRNLYNNWKTKHPTAEIPAYVF